MLSRAVNLGLFDQAQLHRTHGALRLCHEVYVFYLAFVESNRPVRIVVSYRRGNIESIRQFHVNRDIGVRIKVCGKIALIR